MHGKMNDGISGRNLVDRLMDFMDAGDVVIQKANRRIGARVLPEFSMIPALLAVLGLTLLTAWCGVEACRLLNDDMKNRNDIATQEEVSPGDVLAERKVLPPMRFKKAPAPVPQGFQD